MSPQQGESALTPTLLSPAQSEDPTVELFAAMNHLMEQAAGAVQSQNADAAKQAAMLARAVFEQGKQKCSPDDLFFLGLLGNLICLFEPLTRALVLQTEGRFSEAIEGIDEALKLSDQVTASINAYAGSPGVDLATVGEIEPMLRPFSILFRGMRAYIQADLIGYQGLVSEYLDLLGKAITEFKRVNELAPSDNPMFLMLAGICTTLAERLQTRRKFFELKSGSAPQYAKPAGKKILIIHGRNEGKWRELSELLKERYKQDVLVLKQTVNAGSVLIHKFVKNASECSYAIALLTPDDFVKNGEETIFQARPNVLFELGWFYGHFGPDRVCIVKQRTTAIPSDLEGILSIDFSADITEGALQIEDELRRIGLLAPELAR